MCNYTLHKMSDYTLHITCNTHCEVNYLLVLVYLGGGGSKDFFVIVDLDQKKYGEMVISSQITWLFGDSMIKC